MKKSPEEIAKEIVDRTFERYVERTIPKVDARSCWQFCEEQIAAAIQAERESTCKKRDFSDEKERKTVENICPSPISDSEIEKLAIEHATKDFYRRISGHEFEAAGTVVDPDMKDSYVAGFLQACRLMKERTK